VIFACLAALALAKPQFQNPHHYEILKDVREDNGDGNFNYEFETENDIYSKVVGRPGSKGQSNIEGTFRFILPDGTRADVRFVADEQGYRAESPLIPTPHPLPAHAIEQIAFAQSQQGRAAAGRGRPF
ncbi:Cuticle protein, partial [Homarus americanus]